MRIASGKMQAMVLAVLRDRKTSVSAYEVLDILRRQSPKLAPMTVYRALSALVEQGNVHLLESINAYIACTGALHDEAPILSICEECGLVAETVSNAVSSELTGAVRKSGFAPSRHVIELHGLCANCDDAEGRA